MSGAAFHNGKSRQDVATPNDFRQAVRARFGPIAWDLAADTWNQFNESTGNFFGTVLNSLIQDWHTIPGTLWLNPEYRDILPWAKKCAEESAKGARILMLVPASVETEWFTKYVYGHAHILALTPRLRFTGFKDDYPKPLLLCCYNWGLGFSIWKWK